MSEANKQPDPPNPFANQGRPAFARGGTRAKKVWATLATVGFGIFWVCALFLLAELFGPRQLTIWPAVLTPLGLATGVYARWMMVRENA